MHIHSGSGLSAQFEIDKRISSFVRQFKRLLDDDTTFFELFDLDHKHKKELCDSMLRGALNLEQIFKFSSNTGISIDSLFHGKVDAMALVRTLKGERFALPERYSIKPQKLSRIRSVKGILQYAIAFKGIEFSDQVLKALQLKPIPFFSTEEFISAQVVIDILDELKKHGFSDEQMKGTGTMTLAVNSGTTLGKTLIFKKTPKNLYADIHEQLLHHFDGIFNYKLLKLFESGCLVEVSVRPESFDIFQSKVIGNKNVCLFKQGVYAAFLGHIQNRLASVSESQCMYEGAETCLYHVSW